MAIPTSGNLTPANIANEIMVDQSLSSDDAKITKFLAKMCFSEKDVKTVEKMTRNQAKSKAWIEHREGRLTASKHHEYFTKVNRISRVKGDVRPKTTHLVANIIHQEENLDHIQAIKWSRDHEADALKGFYAEEATRHINFKLEQAGLFLDKDRAYIGASPDAIMQCSCHGKGVVETKCPFNIRNEKVTDSSSM
eukprot:gene9832-18407_t